MPHESEMQRAKNLLKQNGLSKYNDLLKYGDVRRIDNKHVADLIIWLDLFRLLDESHCARLFKIEFNNATYGLLSSRLEDYKEEKAIRNNVPAEVFFNILLVAIEKMDCLYHVTDSLIKAARVTEAKKKLIEKNLVKYETLFFGSPPKETLDSNRAIPILWLDEYGILTHANCDKLPANKLDPEGRLAHSLKLYDKAIKKEPFKNAAQLFFDFLSDKPLERVIENAHFWIILASNGLEKHSTLAGDKALAEALVLLKENKSDSDVNIELVRQSKTPYASAKALVLLVREGIDTQFRTAILKSKFPDRLANGICTLKKNRNKETCDLLCRNPEWAPGLAISFNKLFEKDCFSLEIALIVIENGEVATILGDLFCLLHPMGLSKGPYFKLLSRSLKIEFQDCFEREAAFMWDYSTTQAMATKFCDFMKLFTPTEMVIIERMIAANANKSRSFSVIIGELMLFNKMGLLEAANRLPCFTLLFNFVPSQGFTDSRSFRTAAPKEFILDLKSKKVFDGPVGQANFALILGASNEQLNLLINSKKSFAVVSGPQYFNAVLNLLGTPALFEQLISGLNSIQQNFDALIVKKEGKPTLQRGAIPFFKDPKASLSDKSQTILNNLNSR